MSGHIDNVHSPEDCTGHDSKFLQWRSARIYVEPGTHTLSFTQHREWQDNGHMVSQLDELALGDLMVGEDTTGKRRWLYNGEKVQKAEWWAWPRQEEHSKIPIAGRVSTAPDYITLDKLGRILYGNPNYVVRLKRRDGDSTLFELDNEFGSSRGDGYDGDDRGYVRFTASVLRTVVPQPPCEDPDPWITVEESVNVPPWGAFQILPVGEDGDFQVRGANASINDATDPLINEGEFTYEHPVYHDTRHEKFVDKTRVVMPGQSWSKRLHSWTITDHGQHLRPHFEIIWRPTLYAPAWPEESWPSPPYQAGFANSDGTSPWGTRATRPRNPLSLVDGSKKPRWSSSNFIVTTTFSDTFTQYPQGVWVRRTDDPTGEDAWPVNDPPPSGKGPYPSAIWQMQQSRYSPTGIFGISFSGPETLYDYGGGWLIEEVCPDEEDPEDPERHVSLYRVWQGLRSLEATGYHFYGYTDFDAVDVPCVCCE